VGLFFLLLHAEAVLILVKYDFSWLTTTCMDSITNIRQDEI